jgi:hypothetical protein
MQFLKHWRNWVLLGSVLGISLAGAAGARAEGFIMQNAFRSKKDCCPPNGFFGYYPTVWRQWPVVCAEPAAATMTVLPPSAPAVEPAPAPMETPPEKKTEGTAPMVISAPATEPPFLPKRRGPTYLKAPVIQR